MSDSLVMFPAPVCPPNNLRRGDHVVHIDGTRGIVTNNPGTASGSINPFFNALARPQDVHIRISAQSNTCTDNHKRQWSVIPSEELTVAERMRSIVMIYGWPSHEHVSETSDWSDGAERLLETLLVEASVTFEPDEDDRTMFDLALRVAEYIDDLIQKNEKLTAQVETLTEAVGDHDVRMA